MAKVNTKVYILEPCCGLEVDKLVKCLVESQMSLLVSSGRGFDQGPVGRPALFVG